MKYNEIYTSVRAQFMHNNAVTPFITGAPGGGKSALAEALGSDKELAFDRVISFFPSLREPVDLLGLPKVIEKPHKADPLRSTYTTYWIPPSELLALSSGRNLLILEELSDAPTAMQNALCGLILTRKVNNLVLSPNTQIIATGNRVKDKSGANRVVSKLMGRVRHFAFEENLDDWIEWGQQPNEATPFGQNINPIIIQFIRWKPSLLSAFDPDQLVSPTPRNWHRVSQTPTSLYDSSPYIYQQSIAGDVGEGAAVELTAFMSIYKDLPDPQAILGSIPDAQSHAIPDGISVLFALCGSLVEHTTAPKMPALMAFISRIAPEFQVMVMRDIMKTKPKLASTQAFKDWAMANSKLLLS